MSSLHAPECKYPGCTRRTWSTLCFQHKNAPGTGYFQAHQVEDVARPESAGKYRSAGTSPEVIFAEARSVFTDMNGNMHPQSLREQSIGAIRAAVSVDVYRDHGFPAADAPDKVQRYNALKQYHESMIEMTRISPVTFTDDEARALASSSADRWGRGTEETVGLASYGVRKEWELAQSMGLEKDENGIPYSMPYERYCDQVHKTYALAMSDELFRQMDRFPEVIRETSGREPLCEGPVIGSTDDSQAHHDPNPNPTPQQESQGGDGFHLNEHEAKRQASGEGSPSMLKELGKIAFEAIKETSASSSGSQQQQNGQYERVLSREERREQRRIERQIERERKMAQENERKRQELLNHQYDEMRKEKRKARWGF